MKMATRTRGVNTSILEDRMDILNRTAVEDSPAHEIFKTVGAILVLIKVSPCAFLSPCSFSLSLYQDRMIIDEEAVQLSEYCFNACETLKTAIPGDYLNESVKTALDDLNRCVNQPPPRLASCVHRFQGYVRNRTDS